MKVYIEDIVDKMEEASDEWRAYLNINTGEIVDAGIEYLGLAENSEDDDIVNNMVDWEKEFYEAALEIIENWNQYIKIPTQFDINEYSMMEEFIETVENSRKSSILYKAISGKGAFRRFKDAVCDLGLEKCWLAYRNTAYCKIAQQWCEDSKVQYEYKKSVR